MVSVDVCQGNQIRSDVPPAQISDLLQTGEQVVWVDVNAPTAEDWELLAREFRFHPLAIEDAQKQNQRPKLDLYDDHLFLTARTWSGVHHPTDDLMDATEEVDIFVGPNYLVTIHDCDCIPVEETRQRWKRSAHPTDTHPMFLLYVLLDTIVDAYFPAMDVLDEEIDAIETGIYAMADTPIDLKPAFSLKKRLLLLRQTTAPTRDVLNQLLRAEDNLVPPATRLYFQDVYDHTLRLVEQVDLHRDILTGVMDAMMAQTNNRLNQVMKTLTGISTILMSAGLIASIYGMNFKYMPELETRYGYPFALGSMALVAGGLALYFRKIKWFG